MNSSPWKRKKNWLGPRVRARASVAPCRPPLRTCQGSRPRATHRNSPPDVGTTLSDDPSNPGNWLWGWHVALVGEPACSVVETFCQALDRRSLPVVDEKRDCSLRWRAIPWSQGRLPARTESGMGDVLCAAGLRAATARSAGQALLVPFSAAQTVVPVRWEIADALKSASGLAGRCPIRPNPGERLAIPRLQCTRSQPTGSMD